MKKVSVIMCNDMHMDIERANELLSCISQNKNYQIHSDYTEADIIIIMTCAFGTGKQYSMYVIADVQQNVKENATIIVTGCLEKTNKKELEAINGIIVKSFSEVKNIFGESKVTNPLISQNKVIISKGCLKKCSYCLYPLIEGNYQSKPMKQILEEVEALYQKEMTIYITGELETSDYGIDLYGKRSFAELLDLICTNYPECNYVIGWFHPSGLTDEVLSVIEKHKNIVEIMVHIQHVSKNLLNQMHRPTFEFTNFKLTKLKAKRPDIIISSEVIVGFPGETTDEFKELIDYLDSGIFNDLGVASYEPVLGTKAARLNDLPSKEIRLNRMNIIKERYNCTAYPYSGEDFVSILKVYMEACSSLSKIPSMVLNPEERQKYQLIAGVDTESKMPQNFGTIIAEIFEKIINARDQVSINKLQRYVEQTYTEEFRAYIYEVFKTSDVKPFVTQKAKKILFKIKKN